MYPSPVYGGPSQIVIIGIRDAVWPGLVANLATCSRWTENAYAIQLRSKKISSTKLENVNNHNYDELLKAVAPNVHHRFVGAHSIGGERHDKEAMRRWLGRVGRVLPNLHIKVNDIWVKSGPWYTTVFVQWDATATLLNDDPSYFNRGFHVITMRWGKVYSLDVLWIPKRWRAGSPFKPKPAGSGHCRTNRKLTWGGST